MVRNITIGQYFPTESKIHSLDARTKIIASLAYIVALFVLHTFMGFVFATVVLGIVIAMSKVPFSFIVRGLKPVVIIIIFTFALNLFMYPGEALVRLGPLTITDVGLYKALFLGFRLILLIIGSSMLTLTTRPISLTDGLESLMKPFSKIGVPAHELAMMMTIALRFIPTLIDETDKIMKAQQARGADFETGNIMHRAKALIPILVPLFISAFRIAQDMAMAMEARCYHGGSQRTRMEPMKYGKNDAVAFVLLILFMGACVLERIFL
ncbi:MAG: energy-coupling factor transporter transmembrane component T family protein [Anaerovoracaceae bacterium]|jgi:energy-coupling factor transport system permease protein